MVKKYLMMLVNAFTFIPERVKAASGDLKDKENYIINATNYAYLKDGKKVVAVNGDTLIVPSYILKTAKDKYVSMATGVMDAAKADATEFIFKKNVNGEYTLVDWHVVVELGMLTMLLISLRQKQIPMLVVLSIQQMNIYFQVLPV